MLSQAGLKFRDVFDELETLDASLDSRTEDTISGRTYKRSLEDLYYRELGIFSSPNMDPGNKHIKRGACLKKCWGAGCKGDSCTNDPAPELPIPSGQTPKQPKGHENIQNKGHYNNRRPRLQSEPNLQSIKSPTSTSERASLELAQRTSQSYRNLALDSQLLSTIRRDVEPLSELKGSLSHRGIKVDRGVRNTDKEVLRRSIDNAYEQGSALSRRGGSFSKPKTCIGGCLKKPPVKSEDPPSDSVANINLDVPRNPLYSPPRAGLLKYIPPSHTDTDTVPSQTQSITTYSNGKPKPWSPGQPYRSQGQTKHHSRDASHVLHVDDELFKRNIDEDPNETDLDDLDPSNTRYYKRGILFSKCFSGDCTRPSTRVPRPKSSPPRVLPLYTSTQQNPSPRSKSPAKFPGASESSSPPPKILPMGTPTEPGSNKPAGEGTSSSSAGDLKTYQAPSSSRTSQSHEHKQHHARSALADPVADAEVMDERELFSRALNDLCLRAPNTFPFFAETLHHRRGGLVTKCLGGRFPDSDPQEPPTRPPRWLDSARNRESARDQKGSSKLLNFFSVPKAGPADLPKEEAKLSTKPPLYGKMYTQAHAQQHKG